MPKRKKKDSLWEQVKSEVIDKGKSKDKDSVTMKAEGQNSGESGDIIC